MLKARLVEGVLHGLSFCFPDVVTLCESESFPHQVLVDNSIQECLLVQPVLLDEKVLDNFWVLHKQAHNTGVDDDGDGYLCRIKFLALIFSYLLKEPSSAIDYGLL